ncbi:MAG: 5-oxoprolinase/urea amidolyase family protein [Gammaproteobacteria bacterium]|nr:MAG: 5-oxoprolinase/urea amidolyase family protein [Gammaproteobacteria bacterium]
MLNVIEPGLETSIQELPGRVGYWEQGFPVSGPMDFWSFKLANLLVGNAAETAGFECQLKGPKIKFEQPAVIAITRCDMTPKIDGVSIPSWTSVAIKAGQTLELGYAINGLRAYIAISGGIDTPPVLGSRATFHMAGVGGVEGYAIKADQKIPIGISKGKAGITVLQASRLPDLNSKIWEIEAVPGPDDDWIDAEGHKIFLSSDWQLLAQSNRTGFRLEGPDVSFTEKAMNKRPEHGSDPSNILDHGYPLGAVNLAGLTPIILVNDSPSTGGFINPYTVPSAAFWKLAQARPNDTFRFKSISVEKAQRRRQEIDDLCTTASLITASI